jgi:hypothetical protein
VYDRENPAGFGLRIRAEAEQLAGRIFVDVTSMSRLLIIQTLVALCGMPDGYSRTSVVYTEAEVYLPTEAEANAVIARADGDPSFAAMFLSSGVFDITVVPELSSVAPPGAQTRLIAFPSLDAHQLTALRAEIHPSRFDFIEGIPPSPENAWRTDAIARLNRLDQIQSSQRFAASTLDYRDNLSLLLARYAARPDRERVLISPTGSKMQTVAVGVFRAYVRDVQIVYPTPLSFVSPDRYTLGAGQLHQLDLAGLRV